MNSNYEMGKMLHNEQYLRVKPNTINGIYVNPLVIELKCSCLFIIL